MAVPVGVPSLSQVCVVFPRVLSKNIVIVIFCVSHPYFLSKYVSGFTRFLQFYTRFSSFALLLFVD